MSCRPFFGATFILNLSECIVKEAGFTPASLPGLQVIGLLEATPCLSGSPPQVIQSNPSIVSEVNLSSTTAPGGSVLTTQLVAPITSSAAASPETYSGVKTAPPKLYIPDTGSKEYVVALLRSSSGMRGVLGLTERDGLAHVVAKCDVISKISADVMRAVYAQRPLVLHISLGGYLEGSKADAFAHLLRGIGRTLPGGFLELLVLTVSDCEGYSPEFAKKLLQITGVPYIVMFKPMPPPESVSGATEGHRALVTNARAAVTSFCNEFYRLLARGASYRDAFAAGMTVCRPHSEACSIQPCLLQTTEYAEAHDSTPVIPIACTLSRSCDVMTVSAGAAGGGAGRSSPSSFPVDLISEQAQDKVPGATCAPQSCIAPLALHRFPASDSSSRSTPPAVSSVASVAPPVVVAPRTLCRGWGTAFTGCYPGTLVRIHPTAHYLLPEDGEQRVNTPPPKDAPTK